MVGQIDFSALQTPDYSGNALKYYRAGQQQTGQEQGGTALGAGDYRGAAAAYGRAGMTDEAAGALKLGMTQDELKTKTDLAAAKQKSEVLVRIAQGLQDVPEGQRKAALQSAYPLLQAAQIDTAPFDQATEDQLSTPALQAFAGQVESHFQAINRGGGGYDIIDRRTGNVSRSVDPQVKGPNAPAGFRWGTDGNLEYIPNGPADPKFVKQKATAQRQAVVANPMPSKAKAPGQPAIIAPAAPWQRKW
jgi:hypothetical protein